MSSLSIFGLGTTETVILILHVMLVALCIWHLTVRSGYGEARMRFVLPLLVFSARRRGSLPVVGA